MVLRQQKVLHMWYTILLSFLKRNYKAIAAVLILGLVGYGVSFVKDAIHAKAIAAMDLHIKQLTSERDALLDKKQEQAKETTQALDKLAVSTEQAKVAQAKVDQLIYERTHPSTSTKVTFDTITECEQALIKVREKAAEDADTYIAEIQQDRQIIKDSNTVIESQKTELVTANTIIAGDTRLITELKVRVASSDSDLKKEEDKKKFWRTTTVVETLTIVGLVLAL
jgi:uncharacterized protein HemX